MAEGSTYFVFFFLFNRVWVGSDWTDQNASNRGLSRVFSFLKNQLNPNWKKFKRKKLIFFKKIIIILRYYPYVWKIHTFLHGLSRMDHSKKKKSERREITEEYHFLRGKKPNYIQFCSILHHDTFFYISILLLYI